MGYDAAHAVGSDRTGSHNLVVGGNHNYVRFGDLVAGFENAVTGDWASVSGGGLDTAGGQSSSVSGGLSASVSGTYNWTAGDLLFSFR